MPDSPVPESGHPKAYYVDRIARTVTTYLVYAENGRDALGRAKQGDVESALGSDSEHRGWGKVRRAPHEDPDDV